MWLMGFGALVSLVAQRTGLGLRIVVIRIVVIRMLKCSGTGFDEDFYEATIWRLYIIYIVFFLSFQTMPVFMVLRMKTRYVTMKSRGRSYFYILV